MPKPKLPEFTVIVDSNVLYAKDVTKLVSSKFMATWQECLTLASLNLLVPEVVKGERIYQLVSTAEKAIENAVKNFDTIAKVTGKETPKLPTVEQLKADVEKRFGKWATEHKVRIVPTPCDKIDWKRVVNDAIWRVSPFVAASEKVDSEKGFRDCLILETIRDVVNGAPKRNFVFICNDTVLRSTVEAQFDPKLVTAYEDLGSFASYLKLTDEELTQEFVNALIKKVPSVFYTENDLECLYVKFKIRQAIDERFALNLNDIGENKQALFTDLLAGFESSQPIYPDLPTALYEAISKEKVLIDTTEFVTLTEPNTYQWKTHLRFVRLFRPSAFAARSVLDLPFEKVRTARFEVSWSSVVEEDETFSAITLEDIQLVEQTTEDDLMGRLHYEKAGNQSRTAS